MKKYVLLILLLIFSLSLFGCKKDNNGEADIDNDEQVTSEPTISPSAEVTVTVTPIPVESHEGEMRSYLSGLWVPEEVGKKRPIAIQFSNFKSVSNQWGISQADIVYEAIVEGGITRLLGIGENYSGDRIGSVRSSRHYFVSIADEYDAIYVHFGKTKYATAKMNELDIDHMDGSEGIGTTVFYRDKTIKAPHNAFASLEGILAGIEKKGFETLYEEGYEPHYKFYEEDTDLTEANNATNVELDFSGYNVPYFEYNATDKLYYRFQFGKKHVDSLTDKQLAFKNIIVQFVKEWDIDKNDYQTMDLEDATGRGYYITNGKVALITWKKNEDNRWMRYYNEAGEELTINPGKTYIAMFPQNRTEDAVIK